MITGTGVVVLGYPLLRLNDRLWVDDKFYENLFSLFTSFKQELIIITRIRNVSKTEGLVSCLPNELSYQICELPDYGSGGISGLKKYLSVLFSKKWRKNFEFIKTARFVFFESVCYPEVLVIVKQLKKEPGTKSLIIQLRGDTLFTFDYMRKRFGIIGIGLAFMHRHIIKQLLEVATHGIYVSNQLKRKYPLGNKGNQAIVIPNVAVSSQPERIRSFKKEMLRFLYVGHLEQVKRVDIILKALQNFEKEFEGNWRLDIIGDGPLRSLLVTLSRELGIADKIHFHGKLPWGNPVFSFYQNADLLLMASSSEGASRTLMEAMSFGLPVITTKVGNSEEILDKRCLVKTNDVEDFSKKLIDICSNEQLLQDLSIANYQLSQSFTQEKLGQKRMNFWSHIIQIEESESVCAE